MSTCAGCVKRSKPIHSPRSASPPSAAGDTNTSPRRPDMRTLRVRLFLSILLPILVIVPVVALMLGYLLQTQVLVANIANELIRQAVLVADISSHSVEIL